MVYQSSYEAFAKSFKIKTQDLYLACANPSYTLIRIPKSNGDMREVFAPESKLKGIQRILALRLNKVYSKCMPKGVMGFVKSKPWMNDKRDIVANANAHRKSRYLINLDIKSFFPSIHTSMVMSTLEKLLHLDEGKKNILQKLILHNGSLPPGSPSSPVISNLVFIDLDMLIQKYCDKHDIIYTRYVDDITLSSKKKIRTKHINYVCKIVNGGGFEINTDKTKEFGKKEIKEVTGIAIDQKKLQLCSSMIDEIEGNIAYYHEWKQRILKQYGANEMVNSKIRTMQKSINGQLSFAKRIDGAKGKTYLKLSESYHKSIDEKVFASKVYL
jgi:RNA-directed DNA polymerase